MTYTERHIVETYSGLLDSLNSWSKNELMNKLAKSLKKEKKTRDEDFFASFGAFASDKTAEEIIGEIKESRRFRHKDLKL